MLGLAILGYRVIQTMGSELIHVDYPKGFSSELSSSITVVMASRLQIPVSSTHCQVGALIGVGVVADSNSGAPTSAGGLNEPMIDAETVTTDYGTMLAPRQASWKENLKQRLAHVQWKSVGQIFLSWLVTVPVSAGISALLAFILKRSTTA